MMLEKDLLVIIQSLADGDVKYWYAEGVKHVCAVALRVDVVVRDILEAVHRYYGDPEDD